MQALAWGGVALGFLAPIVRRKLKLRPPMVVGVTAAAPFALSLVRQRSIARDIGVCFLQMWAYLALYESPGDDREALERRVHIDYPVKIDRLLGFGQIPSVRLQKLLMRDGQIRLKEKVFAWVYWLWFLFPHSTVLYILLRRREKFVRAATVMYGTFDIGAIINTVLPTAPPWYAAQRGRLGKGEGADLRRIMFEYGESFWGSRWEPMHKSLGNNPLAAMPSLHCATSVQAARLLSECGPIQGAIGWAYALPLCFSLIYLGEHYVVDAIVGLALAEGVRHRGDIAEPFLRGVVEQLNLLAAKVQ